MTSTPPRPLLRQWTVDAFATAPFKGNPACVVEPLDVWPDAAWMQALAMENNQAETAFLLRTADAARFGLRWFTPALEVPLCGHATLASAHILFTEIAPDLRQVTFDTLSGPLGVSRDEAGLTMNFPSQPPHQTAVPEGLEAALGVPVLEVWAGPYLVAVVDSEATVRGLKPDIAALGLIASEATGGPGNIGVVALSDPASAYAVISRFFAPGSGIPEDPATGSWHCILAPLYAQKLGRDRLAFYQAHPGRGGDLDCEMVADRVLLRGQAQTVIESRLRLL
jgi:PhzF family phenazine biosynthesis protein